MGMKALCIGGCRDGEFLEIEDGHRIVEVREHIPVPSISDWNPADQCVPTVSGSILTQQYERFPLHCNGRKWTLLQPVNADPCDTMDLLINGYRPTDDELATVIGIVADMAWTAAYEGYAPLDACSAIKELSDTPSRRDHLVKLIREKVFRR